MSGPGLGRLGGGTPSSLLSPGPAPGSGPPALLLRSRPGRHVLPVPWGWPSGWLGVSPEPSAPVGTPPGLARAALRCLGLAGW